MMDFIAFAQCHGVEIRRLEQGDKVFRCPTTAHPRSDNGAYFFDGRRGWVMNWELDQAIHWWNDADAKPWSDAEKRAWADRRRAAAVTKAKAAAEAVQRAAAAIAATTRSTHPYLTEKGFPEVLALVSSAGELRIPMRDHKDNALRGVQTIRLANNQWEKKMSYGMRARGAVFRLGPPRAIETWFVEGYATGLSLELALRMLRLSAAVMVCFSAGNLVYVAQNSAGRRFVFADNDESRAGENAAQASGLPYCMSERVGEDANDLHRRAGWMAVATLVSAIRRVD